MVPIANTFIGVIRARAIHVRLCMVIGECVIYMQFCGVSSRFWRTWGFGHVCECVSISCREVS